MGWFLSSSFSFHLAWEEDVAAPVKFLDGIVFLRLIDAASAHRAVASLDVTLGNKPSSF